MRLRIAGVFIAWVATAATFADTVTLRSDALVSGPSVKLGDVAEIRGENAAALADIELVSAANPGSAKRLSAGLVESRLYAEGFSSDDIDLEGSRNVTATTMHLDITRGMLAEDLRAHILREMPWDIDAATVDVMAPGADFRVPDGDVSIAWRADPQYRYLGQGSFRGEIRVNGRVEKSLYAKANVAAYDDVVVAIQPISRGDRISAANVRLETRELSSLREGAYFNVRDVMGMVAKSTIQPGQPLSDRRLMLPTLIKRNQLVLVETRIGSLLVRTQARAKQDGAAGDFITCENPSSDQEFSGVVRPDGVVEVQ
jgi:flagella basal body P-ring formation protein FlgA